MNSSQQQKSCKGKKNASHIEYKFPFMRQIPFLSHREKASMNLSLLDLDKGEITQISQPRSSKLI